RGLTTSITRTRHPVTSRPHRPDQKPLPDKAGQTSDTNTPTPPSRSTETSKINNTTGRWIQAKPNATDLVRLGWSLAVFGFGRCGDRDCCVRWAAVAVLLSVVGSF